MYDYHDPNEYWLPPQKDMKPEEAFKIGCCSSLAYLAAFVVLLICCALFSSCGSYKKTVKENTERTEQVNTTETATSHTEATAISQSSSVTQTSLTERTDDSTEVVITTETTWYDTSKSDSSGHSPVLKTEKQTIVKHKGRTTERKGDQKNETTNENALTSVNNSAAIKEESAKREETKSSEKDLAATETKQLSYATGVLLALSLLIIVGILAYWVKSKYRQRS